VTVRQVEVLKCYPEFTLKNETNWPISKLESSRIRTGSRLHGITEKVYVYCTSIKMFFMKGKFDMKND